MAQVRTEIEEAVAFGRALGRGETATFYETISHSVSLASYEDAKKSKTYRFLVNPKTRNYFTSLDEFCEVNWGVSYRRMQQIAGNRNLIGQEVFEQSERLGLRQIDYNAIKALPAPEQEIVKRAVREDSSREEVVVLIQELAGQHQREREEKDKRIVDLTARTGDLERLNAEKNKKLDELSITATSAISALRQNWPEVIAVRKNDLHALANSVDFYFAAFARLLEKTRDEMGELEDGSDGFAAYKTVIFRLGDLVERVCTTAANLRSVFETELGGYISMDKTRVLEGGGAGSWRDAPD